MNNHGVYADGTGWLILIAVLALAIAAAYIAVKAFGKREIKRLNRRRSDADKPCRSCECDCALVRQYQSSIEELTAEIEFWKKEYRAAELKCMLQQETISKLRK